MEEILTWYTTMHPAVKVLVVALGILFVLAILKRLLKAAVLVAILIILIFVLRAVIIHLD